MNRILTITLITILLLNGCSDKENTDPYIAKVGSSIVSLDQFLNSYKKIIQLSNLSDSPELRKMHAEKLVEKKLLAIAARNKNLNLDNHARQQVELAKEDIMRELLYERKIAQADVTIPDSMLRKHYRWKNTEVKLRHIFHQEYSFIDSLSKIIKQDTVKFIHEAKLHLKNIELKNSGGNLGWIPYDALDPNLEEHAFSMSIGKIAEPVQSSYGWHILYKENEKYQLFIDENLFQSQKEKLRIRILQKKRQIIADQYVNNLIQDKEISINDSLFYYISALIGYAINSKESKSITETQQESIYAKLTDVKKEVLANIEGKSLTVDDFIIRLQTQPPNIINGNLTTGLYRIIRDIILAKEAKDLSMNKHTRVKQRITDVQDNYYTSLFLKTVLPRDSTHIQNTDLKKIADSLANIYTVKYNDALLDTFVLYLKQINK